MQYRRAKTTGATYFFTVVTFKTQWVGNKILLGLLGFLRQPNLQEICVGKACADHNRTLETIAWVAPTGE